MNLIFVSSPQKEFAKVRKELCYFILTDPYLKRYFDVFLFENLPAGGKSPRKNYRRYVRMSTIYLGLFGKTYGTADSDGISATEKEFDYATSLKRERIVFLKRLPRGEKPVEKMQALAGKANDVTYATFRTNEELKRKVMQSLLQWQDEKG